MIGVFIIPTGIGCSIGGHAGDASPAAKLIASCCDKLIVHPNVVNASDINEMTENMLYVEGSILDRFLRNEIYLKGVNQNKILLVVNKPVRGDTINAVNAARYTIGANIEIIELDIPLIMKGFFNTDNSASGQVTGHNELCKQIKDINFDALALHTEIDVPRKTALNYLKNGGVNPWGGVEAIASKLIANKINKPVAHAPMEKEETITDRELMDYYKKPVKIPQIAAELLSTAFLHSVLKGLHKAPKIGQGLSVGDIDFLMSPDCWGEPHEAAIVQEIPIIIVEENKTIYNFPKHKDVIYVENYLEAAGFVMSMKAGVIRKAVIL